MAAKFIEPISDFGPDSAKKVWRKVEEIREVVNSILSMRGEITGRIHCLGRLDVDEGAAIFRFEETNEIGSEGT